MTGAARETPEHPAPDAAPERDAAPPPDAEPRDGVSARDGRPWRDPAPRRDPASYRDPSGFVFRRDGVVLRQIQPSFAHEWEAILSSGLHGRLVERGMLVAHEDAALDLAADRSAWRVIRPEPIDFISYPFEWTFGELKDAALLTLDAQIEAIDAGFTLRDASAYNVQFRGVQPVLIDSLSFGQLEPDAPWVAYRQFCEHFLAPLALMAYRDVRLGALLRASTDGIPLDLAARLLPGRTKLRPGLAMHLHLHARAQRQHADVSLPASTGASGSTAVVPARRPRLSRDRLRALVRSLRSVVEGLDWEPSGTEWADYADRTSYDDEATRSKARLVDSMVRDSRPGAVWDLGANTGRYSEICAGLGRRVIAFDLDPAAAERHYRALRKSGRTDTTPILIDLADPSPSVGWAGSERRSLADRSNASVLLALALVHHLAIGRNVPLPMIGEWLARLGPELIIEWVPKHDPMVQRLLAAREDVFPGYHEDGFREGFSADWEVADRQAIEHSDRALYRMKALRPGTIRANAAPTLGTSQTA